MRVLVAACLYLLAGCYHDSAPTTVSPGNKQRAPDTSHAADDELAFIPKESEIVLGFDFAGLRESAAWHDQLEPVLTSTPDLAKARSLCGFDPVIALSRAVVGIRQLPVRSEGTLVTSGGDAQALIGCLAKAMGPSDVVTHDGDVTVMTSSADKFGLATLPVGRSHTLTHAGPDASAQVVRAALQSGSPLRDSPAFMAIYDKLEHGAAMWFVINGNAKVFQDTASMGLNPRFIDGTLTVTDRYVLTARLTMPTPGDATRLATLVRGVAKNITAMVESLDIAEDGPVVRINVVVTQPQAQTILAAFGGIAGP